MEVEVNTENNFFNKIKTNWKKIILISLIILIIIFLIYPRYYSYNLNNTCNSKSGIISARCIGFRSDMLEFQEQTIDGESCSIEKQGQKCMGISIFERLN